jgi:hypothetical protein
LACSGAIAALEVTPLTNQTKSKGKQGNETRDLQYETGNAELEVTWNGCEQNPQRRRVSPVEEKNP